MVNESLEREREAGELLLPRKHEAGEPERRGHTRPCPLGPVGARVGQGDALLRRLLPLRLRQVG
jgi:hypothetical protein